ncbi:hypothetical protein [Ideonella livida]|uniref:Zinc-regulated TonB-dependent outer membrane receptor n=1 Tax=Ideonella livida TaxID=2707176 RepID=A0A7C9TN82_9BURK|nr:hypothetical protein [Ideonella livida]NDY93982.1 hypothetical protein [Ideonella livida]
MSAFLRSTVSLVSLLPWLAGAPCAQAQEAGESWQFGAVLDVATTSRPLALGGRDQGLQLGHSDLSASGPLGRHLQARLTGVLATHEGRLETELEEAWVESRTLPGGLSLRAGRFASQIGYLNAQHPHADDFVERPLLYRAFLGGHWNDDGLRLNLTLPTSLYWVVGAEVMRGKRLVAEADPEVRGAGAFTLSTKLGGDWDRANSWQLGLSYLKSRRLAAQAHEEEEAEGEAHDPAHEHEHAAQYGGRHLWLADATWKWAPEGNNRDQQLRVTVEAARVTGLTPQAGNGPRHAAESLAVVWRFHPHWELGSRLDQLRVQAPHDGEFHSGQLREQALMLAWKPSHLQTVRLQASRQRDAVEIEGAARRAVALQYILAFGAHGAHAF